MRFTVKSGTHTLVWEDGTLTGPTKAITHLVTHAAALEGHSVGFPTGPATTHNHLADPLSALRLLLEYLGPDAVVSGDVPELDDVPEGAIA